MDDAADLEAPVFLVAMPQVDDPFFHKSVVLLLEHQDDGSFGFILNRPTGVDLTEILEGMDLTWNGPKTAEAFIGGPVQAQLGSVLFRPESNGEPLEGNMISEVIPGLFLTQHVGDLEHLAQNPPEDLRLLLGYAAWGAGQLVEEILRNDWILAPVRLDLAFEEDPEHAWEKVLRTVGIDPAALPTWTMNGGEESTN